MGGWYVGKKVVLCRPSGQNARDYNLEQLQSMQRTVKIYISSCKGGTRAIQGTYQKDHPCIRLVGGICPFRVRD